MSVYIDNARIPYRGMKMCHMIADTTVELLEMADRIGVDNKWIQQRGTHREHFDVCSTRRDKALIHGALSVSTRDLVHIIRKKRGAG